MHVTIYPHRGWFGPEDRQRLAPWGCRFGPVNPHGNSPIVQEPVLLHLMTLAAWEALLRDLRCTTVVVGARDCCGDQAFTLVLEPPQGDPHV